LCICFCTYFICHINLKMPQHINSAAFNFHMITVTILCDNAFFFFLGITLRFFNHNTNSNVTLKKTCNLKCLHHCTAHEVTIPTVEIITVPRWNENNFSQVLYCRPTYLYTFAPRSIFLATALPILSEVYCLPEFMHS